MFADALKEGEATEVPTKWKISQLDNIELLPGFTDDKK